MKFVCNNNTSQYLCRIKVIIHSKSIVTNWMCALSCVSYSALLNRPTTMRLQHQLNITPCTNLEATAIVWRLPFTLTLALTLTLTLTLTSRTHAHTHAHMSWLLGGAAFTTFVVCAGAVAVAALAVALANAAGRSCSLGALLKRVLTAARR